MLITNLLVAGSIAYAGVKTVVEQVQRKPASAPSTTVSRTVILDTVAPGSDAAIDPAAVPLLAERRYRAIAATSFWLSVGGFFFPTLTFASIPLTVYSAVPIFEAGCQSLYAEGRVKPSVINTILISSTLLTDRYLPAATLTWLHHTFRQLGQQLQSMGKQVTSDINNEVGDLLRQAMGGAPRAVWIVQDTVEVKVPFDQVKVGDVVVISRGEFVPVDGVITAGTATVNLMLLTRSTTPTTVDVGDKIYTSTFVTEGRISVQVEEIRLYADA